MKPRARRPRDRNACGPAHVSGGPRAPDGAGSPPAAPLRAAVFAWNGVPGYVYANGGQGRGPRGRSAADRTTQITEGGMNKAELADALAERTNLPRKDSRAAVDDRFGPGTGLIRQALQRREYVPLTGIRTFEARPAQARTA